MATIETRKTSKGTTTYRVKIRHLNGPSLSATFHNKKDAKEWASQTELEISRGKYFKDADNKNRLMKELMDRYRVRLQTHYPKRVRPTKHFIDFWERVIGHISVKDVSRSLLVEKREQLMAERQISHSTVNLYMLALSHIFTIAINEWEWADINPVSKIKAFPIPKGRTRFLSQEEMSRLLKVSSTYDTKMHALILLALSTGARYKELLSLKWDDIDVERKRITFHKTKNGEIRSVPMTNAVSSINWLKIRDGNDYIFADSINPTKLMTTRYVWKNILKKSDISDFKFHDLRHTAASYLAMSGATLNEIAEILGHKTLAMVKRYAHLSESHTSMVLNRMNDQIFKDL